MSLPDPEPGLVFRFNYLWTHERARGRDNARYPRPCALMVAHRRAGDGGVVVLAAPITHQPPGEGDAAVAIPRRVKQALGLDAERSWVILDEVNEFVWPGLDLAPDADGELVYGFLPPALFEDIRRQMFELASKGRLGRVPR